MWLIFFNCAGLPERNFVHRKFNLVLCGRIARALRELTMGTLPVVCDQVVGYQMQREFIWDYVKKRCPGGLLG